MTPARTRSILLLLASLLGVGGAVLLAWTASAATGDRVDASDALLAGSLLSLAWIAATAIAVWAMRATPSPAVVDTPASAPAAPTDPIKATLSRHVAAGLDDADLDDAALAGERAALSVLFCDIRGFTSWSEDKGATEVIAELNLLLGELSASVLSTGGTLDKFTGDGLMAFWGAPIELDDHAGHAVRAGLDMLDRLARLNERRIEAGQDPVTIGVAVHSGAAVVGTVGHERRLDYTAVGDTVATAERLERSARDLGEALLVSGATHDLLDDELRDRARSVTELDLGDDEHLAVWAVDASAPAAPEPGTEVLA